MPKATMPEMPTGSQLNREAILLRELYKAYVDDREFLRRDEGRKILFFLDSHEVKAYIDPDAPGTLAGFILQLERAFGEDEQRTTVSLRHDQILNGLLFDPSRTCGILPSHAEEMDREVAFRSHQWLDTVLKLVRLAQQEIRSHRRDAQKFSIIAQIESPDQHRQLQTDLVRFFQKHAPALTTILRDTLFSPHRRLKAILDNSRVALFEDIHWADYGVSDELAETLRKLQPTDDHTTAVRNSLSTFEYRKNSIEANLIDAAALAHMQLLRAALDNGGAHHLRVVLVSRARTFQRAATDMAAKEKAELLVRHPRMLALTTPDAIKVDDASKLALGTALEVWHSQIRNHMKPSQEGPSDIEPLTLPARAFLDSWNAFESSRLAIEAKWRDGSHSSEQLTDDGKLAGQLITMFCANNDPEAVLNQVLIERFTEFSNASSRFLLESAQLSLPARLTKIETTDRVYIAPISLGAVGPIQVADWPGSPPSGQALSLDEIAKRVRFAERPLLWSLALACAGRWKEAAIFVRSALQLAELEHSQETQDEARLLRAEIRRLGAHAVAPADFDEESDDASQRYARAIEELKRVSATNAHRRLREEAAQLLEVALSSVEIPERAAKLRAYFDALDLAVDRTKRDEFKARYIALLLMLYLFGVRHAGKESLLRRSDQSRAAVRHSELVIVLQRLQKSGQIDAIPHRARAMEVIGYRLFEVHQSEQRLGKAPIASMALEMPSDLPGEIPDLLDGLMSSSDKIGALLKDEIEAFQKVLGLSHNPELLLAPLAVADEALEPLKKWPELAESVNWALKVNETAGLVLLGTTSGPANETDIVQAIRKLDDAVARGKTYGLDSVSMFYLQSALLYSKLLDATLEPRYTRGARFELLIIEYQGLSAAYPNAALPYIRLAYLADKTKQEELLRSAITAALDYVDSDQYYPGHPAGTHWLQSFVRRRHATIILRGVPRATKHWTGAPGTSDVACEIAALIEACRHLLDADRRDVAINMDAAHELERQRRLNNIAFYGARLMERTGSEQAFSDISPNRSLQSFIDQLTPDGIEAMQDLDIVHTVGCYYAVAKDMATASRAAQRIYTLMGEGKRITGPDAAGCYDEMFGWFNPSVVT